MPTPEFPSFDVDLQDLYEHVLAGFNNDPFPELPTPVAQNKASTLDLEPLYSYAGDSTAPSSKLAQTLPKPRIQTHANFDPGFISFLSPVSIHHLLFQSAFSAQRLASVQSWDTLQEDGPYFLKFLLIPNVQCT